MALTLSRLRDLEEQVKTGDLRRSDQRALVRDLLEIVKSNAVADALEGRRVLFQIRLANVTTSITLSTNGPGPLGPVVGAQFHTAQVHVETGTLLELAVVE